MTAHTSRRPRCLAGTRSAGIRAAGIRGAGIAALLALLIAPACDDSLVSGPLESSSSLANNNTGRVDPNAAGSPKLLFNATGATENARVELEPTKTGDSEFEVRLLLRDFPNLYGIAGHLRYDPKVLTLVTVQMHKVLQGKNYDSRSVGADKPKGRLLLGATRFKSGGSAFSPLAGVPVGKEVWATLTFKLLADGKHTIAFDPTTTMAKSATYEDLKTSYGGLVVEYVGGAK
jgi:hypothetical protein